MEFFRTYILPILIGGIIGYFTNFIAIKMLFRPKKALYIGNFHIPFTPGIIPHNQSRIAQAAGAAVGQTLVTDADIKNMLLSDGVKDAVVDKIISGLTGGGKDIGAMIADTVGQENLEEVTDAITDYVYTRIDSGFHTLDLGKLISEQGAEYVKKNVSGMLSLVLNDSVVKSMAEPLSRGISDYFEQNGEELIKPVISGEVELLTEETLSTFMAQFGIDEEFLGAIVGNLYTSAVTVKADDIIKKFDIQKIVADKINEMSTDALEELVMSIMKKELNAIVNLGAVIGGIIGILNIVL